MRIPTLLVVRRYNLRFSGSLTDKASNQEPADWTITGCRPFHHCVCCVATHHRQQQQQQQEADFKLKKVISTQTYRPVIAAICCPIFVSTEFLKEENEKQSSKTKTVSWRKKNITLHVFKSGRTFFPETNKWIKTITDSLTGNDRPYRLFSSLIK